MKTATLLALLLTACSQAHAPELPAAEAAIAYDCRVGIRTCSPSDARVCFVWCSVESITTSGDPTAICADRGDCDAECWAR